MMRHREWLQALIEAARNIASRDYQEKNWFRECQGREWADEVFLRLEDLAFSLYFQKYSFGFTHGQLNAWKEFEDAIDCYETKLTRFPDSQIILDDSEWQRVREAAALFITAFEPSLVNLR